MEVTLFKGAKNPAPENMEVTWETLCEFIGDMAGSECQRANKLNHYAMIFGRCVGRRANANIQFLSGLCADFDTEPTDAGYVSFDAMCDRLESDGYAYIAYTTTNNEAGHNRYRLVMPYARDIGPEQCVAAWHACNAKLGGQIDPSTKDPARLSFLSADWQNDIFWEKGNLRQLVEPFNALRCGNGKPVLDESEIDALSVSISPSDRTDSPWRDVVQLPALTATQAQKLAQGQKADAACWSLLASLQHSPLVTKWMRNELPNLAGNRDYRFLSFAASNAVAKKVPVNVDTLTDLAEQFSRKLLNREPPADIVRQAENALAWAFHNSPPANG